MNSNNASGSMYMAQPGSHIHTMEQTMDRTMENIETTKSPQNETSGGLEEMVFNTGVSLIDAKSKQLQ